MMRTLRDMNMSKFVAEDVPLFLSLIDDLFPGLKAERSQFPEVTAALEKVRFLTLLGGLLARWWTALPHCAAAPAVPAQLPAAVCPPARPPTRPCGAGAGGARPAETPALHQQGAAAVRDLPGESQQGTRAAAGWGMQWVWQNTARVQPPAPCPSTSPALSADPPAGAARRHGGGPRGCRQVNHH